jgi:hypothetical protein
MVKRGDVVVNVWLEVTAKTLAEIGPAFCVYFSGGCGITGVRTL